MFKLITARAIAIIGVGAGAATRLQAFSVFGY